MKKNWIRIVLAVVALLLVVILVIPLFVNANTFRPTLETQMSNALGRQVTLGNLSFSLFSGSLVANNIVIADDPAFGSKPFIAAKALHIGVEMGPLIFHRQLVVTSFVADSPAINLVHASNGTWNFSSIGRPDANNTPEHQKKSAFPNLTIGEIKIENGIATVSNLPAAGQPLVYSDLNLSLQQFSYSKSFPFQLSAKLPGDGSLDVKGNAGPVSQQDASDTPLNADIQLTHFDPVAAGVIDKNQGMAMLLDIGAKVTSNGQTLTSNGTVRANGLKLVSNGLPAPRPVDITYAAVHNLDARSGQINSLDIKTGSVATHVTGTYQIPAQQAVLALRLSAPNLPIDEVETLLPTVGIRLPSGSSLHGGTLTANLNLTGPVNAITVNGPVQVSNTRLAGFDLGSKIDGLKPVGGGQGGTQIQTIRADVTSSPSGTGMQNIYVSVPALGTATGNGTVSPAGGLNFRVLAKLNAGSGVAGQALGGLSAVSGGLSGAASTAAANGIPVTITGTTSQPVIRADLSQVLKQNAGGLLQQQRLGSGAKQSNPAGALNKLIPR